MGERFRYRSWTPRQWLTLLVAVVLLSLLAVELATLLPAALARWNAFDYWRYVEIGRALRANPYSYGAVALDSVYPLPAELWIFVPLSLLPDWFRIVWVIVPLVSLYVLYRRDAIWWCGFPPLWFVIGDGTIDGLLILPLSWLIENRPVWAAVGALAMLVKPQLVVLPLVYMMLVWIVTRNWRQLAIFWGGAIFLSVPAFVLDPLWILHMLQSLGVRSDQMNEAIAPASSSIWSWLEKGMPGIIVFVAVGIGLIFLTWQVMGQTKKRAAGFGLLDLLLFWVLYASSLVLATPAVRTRQAAILLTLGGLAAAGLTRWFDLGAAYSLVPLLAMFLLSRQKLLSTNITAGSVVRATAD